MSLQLMFSWFPIIIDVCFCSRVHVTFAGYDRRGRDWSLGIYSAARLSLFPGVVRGGAVRTGLRMFRDSDMLPKLYFAKHKLEIGNGDFQKAIFIRAKLHKNSWDEQKAHPWPQNSRHVEFQRLALIAVSEHLSLLVTMGCSLWLWCINQYRHIHTLNSTSVIVHDETNLSSLCRSLSLSPKFYLTLV